MNYDETFVDKALKCNRWPPRRWIAKFGGIFLDGIREEKKREYKTILNDKTKALQTNAEKVEAWNTAKNKPKKYYNPATFSE